jgi:hypothetical protein
VEAVLVRGRDETIASVRVAVPPGVRGFRVALEPATPLAPGDYFVRARARSRPPGGAGGSDASIATDSLSVSLRPAPAATGAVYLRRGPTTANRNVPTSDLRFRRTDQVGVEVPDPAAGAAAARLLDRTGRELPIPVTTGVREDPDGSRWLTAHAVLAPLRPGDYAIEINPSGQTGQAGGTGGRSLFAFRIVP